MNALAILVALAMSQAPDSKPMPDVALTDMKGQTVHLSAYRGKKVVLFNWASW